MSARAARHCQRIGVLAGVALVIAACDSGALEALRAAGLTGTAPAGASGFTALLGTITSNFVWIIVTALGLIFTLIAGMMIVGSRSAPDWLFKVIGGIVLILVVIPGVLA